MDIITIIIDVFGGFFLLGLGLWIGYFNDIYHWVGFRRTLSKKNYGIVAIFSRDGRARLYMANLDENIFTDPGNQRTRNIRENCVFRGKDDIPTIEFDLDSSEPMRRFVYITTKVPRVDKDGKPVYQMIPKIKRDINKVPILDAEGKFIPELTADGKIDYEQGEQFIDTIEVPYRAVDVDPVVLNTDKNLLLDWAMSMMTNNIGLILTLCFIIIGLVIVAGGVNGYLGISCGAKIDAVSSQVAECLKNFAVGNMTNVTGRIAVIGG